MRERAKKILKHPLVYGSGIVFFGNLFANFFNFLFNLFMSRSLSVPDYGILASVMSLIGFPALVGAAIIPVVVRFAGDYFATGNLPLLRGFYIQMKKLLLAIGIATFIIFLIFIPSISNFFHIENKFILFITDFIIFFVLIVVINMAFLQAKLAFTFQVLVNFVSAITKLMLGILFVFLGYSVAGAVFSVLVASISA